MHVEEAAGRIRSMEVRGALRIAVAAARALEEEIVSGASADDVHKAADVLRDARPTAVSLPNAVNYVLHIVESHGSDDPAVGRALILGEVTAFISSLESSIAEAAAHGSSLVEDGDVILTICNSSTVVEALKLAKGRGRRFSVFACETRPRWQGHITARELSGAGVDVTLIVDSAAYHTLKTKGVSKVFVGADTVYADGSVVNKVGTSQVALAARSAGVPVYVLTESIKFYPYSMHGATVEIEERDGAEVSDIKGVGVFNPAFDVTSADNITSLVTEDGVCPPGEVRARMEEKFGWMM